MKKVFTLIVLALVMCCCNNNQPQKTNESEKSKQEIAPVKSNQELYPEKFTGAYITQFVQNMLTDVEGSKTLKSLAIIDGNVAKAKVYYLDSDHNLLLKFDNGEWILCEIDGVPFE